MISLFGQVIAHQDRELEPVSRWAYGSAPVLVLLFCILLYAEQQRMGNPAFLWLSLAEFCFIAYRLVAFLRSRKQQAFSRLLDFMFLFWTINWLLREFLFSKVSAR